MEIEQRIKKISIRGRVALGIKCLEIYLEQLEIDNQKEMQNLLTNLWKFIGSKRLDEWEEEITDYDPNCIIETIEIANYEEYKILSKEEVNAYYTIYIEQPTDLADMISWVIAIGQSNLYSGTGEYSESTLLPTLEVVKIMRARRYRIPDLAKFEKSSYTECHGWGIERELSFFD